MKKPLKHSLCEYYGGFSLSEEQLQKFMALSSTSVPSIRSSSRAVVHPQRWPVVHIRKIAMAAISFCILAGLLLFSYGSFTPFQGKKITLSEIAVEAAYHHNKRMSNEVSSTSLDSLREFFSKLDFSLIQSARLPSDNFELLGGRYCSVKGVVAAQLKVKNIESGKVYTYYQAGWPDGVSEISDLKKFYEAGVTVELWKERGLLLILAHDG